MPNEDSYKSAEEFVKKLDAGTLDRILKAELGKLSKDQRSQIAQILLEHEKQRQGTKTTELSTTAKGYPWQI